MDANFIVVGKEWQVLGFQRGSLNIITKIIGTGLKCSRAYRG